MWASFSVTFLLNAVQWHSSFVSGSSTKSTYHTLCRGSAFILRATKGLISPNVPHWLGWPSQEKERLICYVKNSGRSSVRTDDWCVPCSFVVCPNVYCSGWNGRCLLLFALKKCRKYFGTCKVYSKQLNVRSNKCDKPRVEQFILQEDEKSLHNITQQHL